MSNQQLPLSNLQIIEDGWSQLDWKHLEYNVLGQGTFGCVLGDSKYAIKIQLIPNDREDVSIEVESQILADFSVLDQLKINPWILKLYGTTKLPILPKYTDLVDRFIQEVGTKCGDLKFGVTPDIYVQELGTNKTNKPNLRLYISELKEQSSDEIVNKLQEYSFYITKMEAAKYGDLAGWNIINHPKRSLIDTISYIFQITWGVLSLHSIGYIHGDLKMENFLVTDSSNEEYILGIPGKTFSIAPSMDRIILSDFGLSTSYKRKMIFWDNMRGNPQLRSNLWILYYSPLWRMGMRSRIRIDYQHDWVTLGWTILAFITNSDSTHFTPFGPLFEKGDKNGYIISRITDLILREAPYLENVAQYYEIDALISAMRLRKVLGLDILPDYDSADYPRPGIFYSDFRSYEKMITEDTEEMSVLLDNLEDEYPGILDLLRLLFSYERNSDYLATLRSKFFDPLLTNKEPEFNLPDQKT